MSEMMKTAAIERTKDLPRTDSAAGEPSSRTPIPAKMKRMTPTMKVNMGTI